MSRSHRKNPIMGITTCRSEQQDKKLWHKRLRVLERTTFLSTSFDSLDTYMPILEKEVSNKWHMCKDGKHYWSLKNQAIIAEETAQNKGQTLKEKSSIKQRQLHKSMGK